jgi:hypothetical protein
MSSHALLKRPVTLAPLLALVSCAATAHATIVASHSGNTRTVAESIMTNDFTLNFAVFERGGTAGDRFGTGLADFDSRFVPGANSPAFDTTARYLYLYQSVNDGNGSPLEEFTLPVGPITSLGYWPRVLADNGEVIGPNNPFGQSTLPFLPAAPATLGVTNGRVSSTQSDTNPNTLEYDGVQIRSTYDLAADDRLALIGFTSNRPPMFVTPTLQECSNDIACGAYMAPQVGPDGYFAVHPTATYLRAANEESLPAPATIIHLPTALPGQPIAPGDWLLLQRVGNFRYVRGTPQDFKGPHGDWTLRNLWGVFSGNGTLLPDPEALVGQKPAPIPVTDPNYSRVPEAKPVLEGNSVPIVTVADPFPVSMLQPSDIPQDFVINMEGDLANPSPVLVRVPTGATHLFLGTGDIQWFDNSLTTNPGEFGVRIAKVPAGRLNGDYNLSGVVNAGDYAVWRDQRGASGLTLAADGNADGAVTQADYVVWRRNLGRSVPAAPATNAAVPEPAAWVLMISLAATSLVSMNRRRTYPRR